MNQKRIGFILIIAALIIGSLFYKIKVDRDTEITTQLNTGAIGSCILEDGTCLHNQLSTAFIIGEILAMLILALGMYLVFFDKTKEVLEQQAQQNIKVATALQRAEEEKQKDTKFSAFLAGFNENEQKVLKAIKEQDGILQSTLRYRTGLTKTDVSLILKAFEEKKYITKKPEGNTNKIFLRRIY